MKKWNLFSVLFILAICFSACDNENDPDTGDGADNGNKPKDEVKYISSILFSVEGHSISTSFSYDEQNRVAEIENYRPFGNEKAVFKYIGNTMIMNAEYTIYQELGGEYESEIEFTAQLNDNGYISSAISVWKDIDTNDNDTVHWTADYIDGYISKLTYYSDDEYITQISFSWDNGNMTKIEENDQTGIIITYDNDTENNTTNLDINWSTNVGNLYSDDMLEFWILPQFGFFGKKSNNLIKTVVGYGDTYNYQYKFDNAGNLTDCNIGEEYSFKFDYK